MSPSTLYCFMKSLAFSYRINRGQRVIYENNDIVAKRAVYLRESAEARNGDCLIYIDETWIFDKISKKRGWNDNSIPRFATRRYRRSTLAEKQREKNEGRRATVILAHGEDGVVFNCTEIRVTGAG
ncbi:hypothetical protein Aduo_018616 [Ancylostoma duodenale]